MRATVEQLDEKTAALLAGLPKEIADAVASVGASFAAQHIEAADGVGASLSVVSLSLALASTLVAREDQSRKRREGGE